MNNAYQYEWQSLNSVFPKSDLFSTDLNVTQGILNNSSVLASIAAIGGVQNIFIDQVRNSAGIYRIKLWSLGVPVEVVIDDFVAMKYDSTPAFAKLGPNNEIWPLLIEKAIAKVVANYDMTTALTPNDAMSILTGAPGDSFTSSSLTAGLIFDELVKKLISGKFVVASTDPLPIQRAYAVLSATKLSNSVKVVKMSTSDFDEWNLSLQYTDPVIYSNVSSEDKLIYINPPKGVFYLTADAYKKKVATTSF